jgi:hypothetical protein
MHKQHIELAIIVEIARDKRDRTVIDRKVPDEALHKFAIAQAMPEGGTREHDVENVIAIKVSDGRKVAGPLIPPYSPSICKVTRAIA